MVVIVAARVDIAVIIAVMTTIDDGRRHQSGQGERGDRPLLDTHRLYPRLIHRIHAQPPRRRDQRDPAIERRCRGRIRIRRV